MHTRKSDGRIFYIGIGKDKRPTAKEGRNNHWRNTVNKHGYDVIILVDGLTWSRACELETKMIAFYGRDDLKLGPLVNETDGGDGHKNPTEEARKANGDAKRKSQDLFIEQCKEVHGNTYDYSKVEYVSQAKKIIIVCSKHGEFKQDAGAHLIGHGCKKCGVEKSKQYQLKEQDLFIEQCKEVHGNTYDYSKVKYKGHIINLTIICKEHGEFKQTPATHLKGGGCKKCGLIKRANSKRKDQDLFIKQSKEVHQDKYTYDKVDYVSSTKKVIITCKKHGDFKQVPPSHLNGNGCPTCANKGTKKLTDDQVRWIRKNFISRNKNFGLKPLSVMFNVSNFLIGRIVKGQSYVNVI
jgi:hypothetical protein